MSERYSDIEMGEEEDSEREKERKREVARERTWFKSKKLAGYNRRLRKKEKTDREREIGTKRWSEIEREGWRNLIGSKYN